MDFVALQIRQPIHISLDEPPHHKNNMSTEPVKSLCMRAWPAFASELLAPDCEWTSYPNQAIGQSTNVSVSISLSLCLSVSTSFHGSLAVIQSDCRSIYG